MIKRSMLKLILGSNVSIPSTKCILKVKVSFENIDVCFEKNANLDKMACKRIFKILV